MVYLAVALSLTIATVVTLLQPSLHGASGSVLMSPAAFLDPSSTDSLPAVADTVIAVAETSPVLRRTAAAYTQVADPITRARRRAQATESWLRAHLSLRPLGTSSMIEVTATAPRPDDAVALAAAEISGLTAFVREVNTGVAPAPEAGDGPGMRLLPVSLNQDLGRVSPTPVRNTLVALVAGLVVGCASAVLLRRRRQRALPGRVAGELGLPWLGTLTPAQAGAVLRRLLEGIAAAQRRPGHVALVTGSASDAIGQVAQETVASLNEVVRRGVLLDGELGARAIGGRLERARRSAATSGRPVAGGGDWAVLHAPPARRRASWSDAPSWAEPGPATAGPEAATGGTWAEFVVMSGPRIGRVREILPLASVMHCVVLLVGEDEATEDLAAIHALAREATAIRAVVGVIGIADRDGEVSGPP